MPYLGKSPEPEVQQQSAPISPIGAELLSSLTTIEACDYIGASQIADLASTTLTKGAALVGFNNANSYAGGSVGAAIKSITLPTGADNQILKTNNIGEKVWVAPESLVAGADASTGNNFPRKSQVTTMIADAIPFSPSVTGAFKNLKASATGTSAPITVTVDEIVVSNGSGGYKTLSNVSLSISGTSSGVINGLDVDSLTINTWYSIWVIWNGTTTAGLISLSETTPTLPSGYTHKARVGWMRTDGTGNKFPFGFTQYGRYISYLIGTGKNLTDYRNIASGNMGLTQIFLTNFVPVTACKIQGISYLGGANSQNGVCPNSSGLRVQGFVVGGGAFAVDCGNFELQLEGRHFYYYASAATNSNVLLIGWTDNL